MVNVGVSLFFAEISGSAVADVAAIGSVLIPAMKQRRYKATMAAAVTSSSASLAIIIPPSIPMILYGSIADTSIVKLFVAGIIPGLIGGLSMMALCWWLARALRPAARGSLRSAPPGCRLQGRGLGASRCR